MTLNSDSTINNIEPKNKNETHSSNEAKTNIQNSTEEARIKTLIETKSKWDFDFYKKEEKLKKDLDFDKTVILTNLPKIPKKSENKLISVIKKKLKKYGEIEGNGITIVFDENEKLSTGVAVVTFKYAISAFKSQSFKKFDKMHSLTIVSMGDFFDFERAKKSVREQSDQLENNIMEIYLHNQDPRQRSMFMLRDGKETNVFWLDHSLTSSGCKDPFRLSETEDEEKDEKRIKLISDNKMTDSLAYWSPKGRFLASITNGKRVEIWGGMPLRPAFFFEDEKITMFKFTPNESFIVTRRPDGLAKIWDFVTQTCLARFEVDSKSSIKWTFDDSYFAFRSNGTVHVYSSKEMEPIKESPLKTRDIHSFDWAPKTTKLTLISSLPETRTKIEILEMPGLVSRLLHVLQGTASYSMKWGSNLLSLRVQNFKKNKLQNTFFDFFDYSKSPASKQDRLSFSDIILAGKKGEQPLLIKVSMNKKKPLVAISYVLNSKLHFFLYDIQKRKQLIHLRNEKVNNFFWSPDGNILVCAGLRNQDDQCNGQLIFLDIVRNEVISRSLHSNSNGGSWSPCGRYYCSLVQNKINEKKSRGDYKIYDRFGTELCSYQTNGLYQFQWRPFERLTTKQEETEVKNNLETLREEFEAQDEKIRMKNSTQENQEKMRLWKEYIDLMKLVQKKCEEEAEELERLREDLFVAELEEKVEFSREEKVVVEFTEEIEENKYQLNR